MYAAPGAPRTLPLLLLLLVVVACAAVVNRSVLDVAAQPSYPACTGATACAGVPYAQTLAGVTYCCPGSGSGGTTGEKIEGNVMTCWAPPSPPCAAAPTCQFSRTVYEAEWAADQFVEISCTIHNPPATVLAFSVSAYSYFGGAQQDQFIWLDVSPDSPTGRLSKPMCLLTGKAADCAVVTPVPQFTPTISLPTKSVMLYAGVYSFSFMCRPGTLRTSCRADFNIQIQDGVVGPPTARSSTGPGPVGPTPTGSSSTAAALGPSASSASSSTGAAGAPAGGGGGGGGTHPTDTTSDSSHSSGTPSYVYIIVGVVVGVFALIGCAMGVAWLYTYAQRRALNDMKTRAVQTTKSSRPAADVESVSIGLESIGPKGVTSDSE